MKAEAISPIQPKRVIEDRLATGLLVLAGALLLLWPPLLNRAPFVLSDTTTYIRGADAAVFKLTGIQTDWTARFIKRYQPPTTSAPQAAQPGPAASGRAVTLSGRSVYYGAFLYLTDLIAGLWLAVVVQAFVAALCLYLTVRRFSSASRQPVAAFLGLTALLSVASALAFFTGYLMPDLFTGLGVLAAAHLLCRSPPLSRGEKASWFGLLCWSALTHSSNILILLILVVAMLIGRAVVNGPRLRGVGLVTCAIAIGIAGEALFALSVRSFTGDAPVRPPFLTARVIADGPGLAYLQHTCPTSGFALCNHMQGLSRNSDDILWNESPKQGVFSAVGNDEKRRIAREEPRFLLAVLEDRPFDVLSSSAGAVWQQARKWGLQEFNMPAVTGSDSDKVPPRIANELAGSRAESRSMPVAVTAVLSLAASLVSVALLLWTVGRRSTDANLRLFLAALLVGIAADLIVCGAISTPHDRYSMRVFWLLPLGAFVALLSARVRKRA